MGRNALAKDVVVDVHVLVVVDVDGFGRIRLRSGPFEGLVTAQPPALPNIYLPCGLLGQPMVLDPDPRTA